MMKKYLLDSNIIIYALQRSPKILTLLNNLDEDAFFVSSISYLEVLLGEKREAASEKKILRFLDNFNLVVFDKEMALSSAKLHARLKRKMRFRDLSIAATALAKDLTLITADKDFQRVEGLKIEFVTY
jgi:tRNA(fMet)-specific endonuclease VapC